MNDKDRRVFLVDKLVDFGLTDAEHVELDRLQTEKGKERIYGEIIGRAYESACKSHKKLRGIRDDILTVTLLAETFNTGIADTLKLLQHHLGELETDVEKTWVTLKEGIE